MSPQQVERDRLESLHSYDVRDGEVALKAIVALAAATCASAVAQISVVDADRLVFVASSDGAQQSMARDGTFSDRVVTSRAALVLPDVARHTGPGEGRPLRNGVPVQAYAGVPLIGRDGLPLGALCVLDSAPRPFSDGQIRALWTLAGTVVTLLELRRVDRLAGRGPDQDVDPPGQGQRLRRALDGGELITWFQPLVTLADGVPHAMAALLRWQHPQRGIVPAADFLPAIESSGLAGPVGRYVLHQSLRALADMRAQAVVPGSFGVAVNVSPVQLREGGVAQAVLADLAAHRIAPGLLTLSVSGYGGLTGDEAIRELRELSTAGVRIEVDAIGSPSVPGILELPVSAIRLSRHLVARLPEDGRAAAVVRATVSLADELGVEVSAAGVETSAQRDQLVALGCRRGHGHLFSAALPAADLPPLLLPRLTGGRRRQAAGAHCLTVHGTSAEPLEEVASVVLSALRGPGAVLVLASQQHRVELERDLARRGVAPMMRPGYQVLDATVLLAQVRESAQPLKEVLRGLLDPVLREAVRAQGRVHVYSELTALLWQEGSASAAIDVEDLWNDLVTRYPVTLHCGMPAPATGRASSPQIRRLQEQHRGAPLQLDDNQQARDYAVRLAAEGASSHSIAAALNAAGFAPPHGTRWHWRHVAPLLPVTVGEEDEHAVRPRDYVPVVP